MHLLATTPGTIADGSEAVDLGQSPGDIVVLSAADTELACFAAARERLDAPRFPSLRLASLLHLGHNLSVDLYVEKTIASARLVIVRLLGGRSYWPYGVEQVEAICRERGIALALLPGDDQPDRELLELSTLPEEAVHRLWQYCVHGGMSNAISLLCYASSLIGNEMEWREPQPLLRAGLYRPGQERCSLGELQASWQPGRATALLVFYRALVQAGTLKVVDALIDGLQAAGLNPLPVYVTSLKDAVAAATLADLTAQAAPDIILNATAFAVSVPGAERAAGPFENTDCPVIQVIFSGGNEAGCRGSAGGRSPQRRR